MQDPTPEYAFPERLSKELHALRQRLLAEAVDLGESGANPAALERLLEHVRCRVPLLADELAPTADVGLHEQLLSTAQQRSSAAAELAQPKAARPNFLRLGFATACAVLIGVLVDQVVGAWLPGTLSACVLLAVGLFAPAAWQRSRSQRATSKVATLELIMLRAQCRNAARSRLIDAWVRDLTADVKRLHGNAVDEALTAHESSQPISKSNGVNSHVQA